MGEDGVIRWGILGPGAIARKFVTDLHLLKNARAVAVGSRSAEKARAFADEFGAARAYGSYEELAADPDVDVIYVATPHPLHREHSLLAIEGGKAVLCEKPFTVNAREAEEVIAAARTKNVFLMEGHWSRFFPAMRKVRELIAAGAVGDVRMFHADFGFRAGSVDPQSRLFDPALAGGALLDVGCYCVSLATLVFGGVEPVKVAALADVGETGVDEQAAMVFSYPSGALAVLSTAIRTNTPHTAVVMGTDGRITVPRCWGARSFTVEKGGQSETHEFPYEGSGMRFQAEEVGRCLHEGLIESPVMPHAETLTIMRAMDAARAQWGLKYPMES